MAIVVQFDYDGMGAVVDIDRHGEEQVHVESVLHALAEAGVAFGVDQTACDEIVATINEQPPGSRLSRTVARGSIPIAGENGAVTMAVENTRNLIGVSGDFGAIDFHERGSFTPIEKGQLIANIRIPTAGIPGKDVRGNEIKATPGERARLTPGQ